VDPVAVELRPPVGQKQLFGGALGDLAHVHILYKNVVLAGGSSRDHPSIGGAHEGFSGELQSLLHSYAVAQGRIVTVLERGDLKLGLVQTLRPFSNRASLRNDHELGTAKCQRPHVLRVVPVITDRDTYLADLCGVHRGAGVSGRIVTALVKTGIVGDVNHPGAAEERAVGVDDRRAVVAAVAVELEEIEHHHHSELASARGKNVGDRSRHRLSLLVNVSVRWYLRVETFEGELRVTHQLGTISSRRFECGQSAIDILLFVVSRRLLYQCDPHLAPPYSAWRPSIHEQGISRDTLDLNEMTLRSQLPAILMMTASAAGLYAEEPSVRAVGYSIEVEVDPAAGRLHAVAVVRMDRTDLNTRRLDFVLHEEFDIESLSVNSLDAPFAFEPADSDSSRPTARRVVVTLPKRVREAHLEMKITYGGALARLPEFGSDEARATGRGLDDTIGARRVELTWNSSWYPQFGVFGSRFETVLSIDLPDQWTAVCTGVPSIEEVADGAPEIVWRSPSSNDIVVIAAPNLRQQVVDRSGVRIEFYDTTLPNPYLDREIANATGTLVIYSSLLGDPFPGTSPLRVVYSPRVAGRGGFTRPAMIVLSEGQVLNAIAGDRRLSMLRGIAHEAAHFWWNFKTDGGDWINEAFAEFFALLAVETIDSRETYDRLIASYETAVRRLPEDAPALFEMGAPNPGKGSAVRNRKGCLMLHALRVKMGDEAFLAACREFYSQHRGRELSTEDLRSYWNRILGDQSGLIDRWLDSRGGVPNGPNSRPSENSM